MSDMNSKEYWDGRFKGDWAENNGRRQSRFFAGLAVSVFPAWLRREFVAGASLLDWGCALGDGTEFLTQALPGCVVAGCDFSGEAIQQAAASYPDISFVRADLTAGGAPGQSWDFIFSSNTLEHFREPWSVFNELSRYARRGIVLLVPFREMVRIEEHHYTFLPDNVPVARADFHLCGSYIVNGAGIPDTEWAGEQALLIYVKSGDPLLAHLCLRDVAVEKDAAIDEAVSARLISDLRSEVDRIGIEGVETQIKLTAAHLRNIELEGRVTYEKENSMARIRERDKLEEVVASLRAELDLSEEHKRRLKQNTEALEESVSALQSKVAALAASDATARMSLEIATLVEEKKGLMERLRVMELQLAELDAAKTNFRYLEKKLSDEIAEITLKNEGLGVERDALIERLRAMEVQSGESAAAHAACIASERRIVAEMEKLLERQEVDLKAERMRVARDAAASKHSSLILARDLYDLAEVLLKRLDSAESQLNSVVASRSWTLTRPMRKLMGGLRGESAGVDGPQDAGAGPLRERMSALSSRLLELAEQRAPGGISGGRGRTIYIFTGVPFDDIGGGQRAAQFARVLLSRGECVTYVYAYPKWENGSVVESEVALPGLRHLYLKNVNADDVLKDSTSRDVAIFELPHASFVPYLERCNDTGAQTVFELIDAWDSSLGGDWYSDTILNQYILQSRLVVGTAKVLQQSLIERGRQDALYLPNAVNEDIFDCYRVFHRPVEYQEGFRSIVYFGSLYGEWFDWVSVNAAARLARDAKIYLIGDPPSGLQLEENVILLGGRKIDELPAYLQHCDVAILPFKPGRISDAVSPIKIFEYLAMNTLVVANDLPEIRDYPNVLIARDPEHFAELCANGSRAYVKESTDKFVMDNCWSARLDRIVPPLKLGNTVSAIVLMHNNVNIIGRCLQSLQKHAGDYIKEIIVVDNASVDGGPEYVEAAFPEVKLVRNTKNGCSSGRNLGVSHASGEYLAFFDSDQWITGRGGFEEALSLLESDVHLGAVGWAAGWFAAGNESFGGAIVDYLPARGTACREYLEKGYRSDIAYLGSGGLFVPRIVFDTVGGFDEFYDPTCFEDTDFTLAIKAAGFTIGYRNLQGIRHQAHQTTGASGQSDAYRTLFSRNSAYFGAKWAHRADLLVDVPS